MNEVRKKAEELERANRELKRLEEMRADFVSMLVHDLRTPMTGILGSSEIIEEMLADKTDERIMNLVRIIPRESRRMIDLVNNILDFYRLDSAGINVTPGPLNAAAVINEAYEGARVIAHKQNIELLCTVEPDLPPVNGDEAKLLQVLSNLIGNALKFTPAGGKVKVFTEGVAGGRLGIAVSDTGVGIPEDELPYIFDKFKTLQDTGRTKIRGSGLGLYIARAIVEAHGGSISAESRVGQGSTFRFTIPVLTPA
jgi:signal transduction histidine kinase